MRTTNERALRVILELPPLLGALFLLGNYLVSEPRAFARDMGIILTGIPFYGLWQWWSRRARRDPGTPS